MMKKTGKILGVILASTLIFAGCGNTNTKTENTDNNTEAKTYKIGVTQIADHPSLDNCRKGFEEGLKEDGFIEGENVEIEFKSAQNDPDLATQIAQNFVNDKKDLVCGISTPSAQSLYSLCLEKNIPVVFNAISDPVAAKLAKSDTEAMEGITGVSDALPVEAQLKLIREILPDAKNIGILYTTSEDNSVSTIKKYKELAGNYGFTIIEQGVVNEADLPQAIDTLLPKVDCISNMTDNTVVNNLPLLLQKANDKKIPVFGSEEEQVKNGCIASAGLDYVELGRQAGKIAARILKGESASDIPYETLKESKITINKKVAEGFSVPLDGEIAKTAEIVE